MKPTKTQKLLARRFRRAARIIAEDGQDARCACAECHNVGGHELQLTFCRILSPSRHSGLYWLGNAVLEYDKEGEWFRPNFFRDVKNYRNARNQRVIGLLLCAEYVLTTEL